MTPQKIGAIHCFLSLGLDNKNFYRIAVSAANGKSVIVADNFTGLTISFSCRNSLMNLVYFTAERGCRNRPR